MANTVAVTPAATEIEAPNGLGLAFTVASRPAWRYSAVQTVSNLTSGTNFQPIPLTATGFVRAIHLEFTASYTAASGAAVVAGDAPWNLISLISLTDAAGQSIVQPITGYDLMLLNKHLDQGPYNTALGLNPRLGPDYNYAASGTTGSATFRLTIWTEVDARTGYGCIPNLDSNASPLLQINVNPASVAFTGTTPSAATVSVRVQQEYWLPVSPTLAGQPVRNITPGMGDYLETRKETLTVNAQSENLAQILSRGGLTRGALLVSRAAGVRTAYEPGKNFGLRYDNNSIYEGIPVESWFREMRNARNLHGADVTTSYAPLSAGVLDGIDRGVLALNYAAEQPDNVRDSWLSTRVGSLIQAVVTPGASATQLEIISQVMQVRDVEAFYSRMR